MMYCEKFWRDCRKIVGDTPTIKSDRQRKKNIYLLIKNQLNIYMKKAEEDNLKNSVGKTYVRPSEDMIRLHTMGALVRWSPEFMGTWTSEEYGRHIINVVGAYRDSWPENSTLTK